MGDSGAPSITLVVSVGDAPSAHSATLVAGADEVVEVGTGGAPTLCNVVDRRTSFRYVRARAASRAHALNLGVSFASGDWVALSFGDEELPDGWLDAVRLAVSAPDARPVHLFHSGTGAEIPLVVVRRSAFVYGAFDERLASDRLAAVQWVWRIYAARERRVFRTEGIASHGWSVVASKTCPLVAEPITGLLELWAELPAGTRAAILEQALADTGAMHRALSRMHAASVEQSAAVDPYRGAPTYEAKTFWDTNSTGYIRWEIYQPDEPEIQQVIDRLTPRSVLELGCGAGRNTRYFGGSGTGATYAGVDVSFNLLQRATERQQHGSIGITCGDITALPFAVDTFELVFADSTVQHVAPGQIDRCVREIARVAANYICLIEYTDNDEPDAGWFDQVHMFSHDYARLFAPLCDLVWRADTSVRVHPARKEVFLFQKRPRA